MIWRTCYLSLSITSGSSWFSLFVASETGWSSSSCFFDREDLKCQELHQLWWSIRFFMENKVNSSFVHPCWTYWVPDVFGALTTGWCRNHAADFLIVYRTTLLTSDENSVSLHPTGAQLQVQSGSQHPRIATARCPPTLRNKYQNQSLLGNTQVRAG